jgi:hypothetical protein
MLAGAFSGCSKVRAGSLPKKIAFGVVEIAPGNRHLPPLVAKPEFPYACCKV